MNPKAKRLSLMFFVLLIASLIMQGAGTIQASAQTPKIDVKLSLSEPPILGKPVQVTATFGLANSTTAKVDNVTIRIRTFTLVKFESSFEWHGALAADTMRWSPKFGQVVKVGFCS